MEEIKISVRVFKDEDAIVVKPANGRERECDDLAAARKRVHAIVDKAFEEAGGE